MTGLSRTRYPKVKSTDYSWSILHILSLHVHRLTCYAFDFQDYRRPNEDRRTSVVYCRYHGSRHRELRRIFNSQIFHETLVQMDLIYQPCITFQSHLVDLGIVCF